jgi:hypothetical protein
MKEVKACKAPLGCDRTLPASSKHILCVRCRQYDRNAADRSPRWLSERFENVSRWRGLLSQHLPKKDRERQSAGLRALPQTTNGNNNPKIEQIRKRA